MPLTAPLAPWIVFSAPRGDHRQTADFAASLVMGFAATRAFVAACWFARRQEWRFPLVLLFSEGSMERLDRSPIHRLLGAPGG